MTETTARDADQEHLERSRKVWDRWSNYYGKSEQDFAPMLEEAVERLALDHGDTVLEIGCGPGVNFERLRRQVGTEGRIVAIDYSPKMVERARERVSTNGWDNIEVRCADATTVSLDETFDGALASLSMSVLPDATAATRRVYDALAPGSRFVVFDLRTVPAGPLRAVNPFLSLFYRWFANWNPDENVIGSLEATFDAVEVEQTYAAGACYRAVARKNSDRTDPVSGST
jgi:demethylmenaquinone methyltransferase/2-methoxy-6-polyprenyl-1,4-benzoquinol methylase